MITAIPEGKDLLWLDSTAEVAPAGYLVPALRDKQALMVPDAGPAQLVRTPPDPPFASSFIFRINGKIGSDSTLDAKVDSSFRGDAEYVLRAAFRSSSQAQWKDVVQAISRLWSFSGTVSDVEVSSPEATDAPFSLKYIYNRKDYPSWPDALHPPLPPINVTKLGDDDKSYEPIRLESPGEYQIEANIELPKDVVAKPHAAVDITKDFAEYHATYSWEAGVVHVQRRLTIRLREVPRSRSDEYRSFWKSVNDEGDTIISVSSSAPASSEKSNASSAESADARANELLDLGDSFFRQGDYDGAIAQFRKALGLRADDVRAHRTLADVLFNKSDLDGASAEYREALRLNPEDSRAHQSLGDLLLRKKDSAGAAAQYREASRIDPNNVEAHHGLGNILLADGDAAGAIKEYREAVRLKPDDPEAHNNLGIALYYNDDTNGATVEYREALRLKPDYGEAHRNLGDLLFFKRDYTGALEEYREVVRGKPDDSEAHDSLGDALFYKRDVDGAMAEYQAALRLEPDNPRAHTGLGSISLRKGQPEQAIDELKKATAAGDRAPAQAYVLLGGAYASLHRYDEAIGAWRKAEKLLPGDPEEPLNIAGLLIELKRYADAITEVQPIADANPKNARLEFVLGKALLRAGDTEEGMPAFQKAVEVDSSPAMLNGVGYELAEANVHLDDALSYAGRAVEQQEDRAADISLGSLSPADLRLMPALVAEWDTLGWVHYRLGHMEEAEKYISAAWKLGQFPAIGDHLGLLYEKTGKKEQAIRFYKMTLATRHAPQETAERLAALSGSNASDESDNAAVEDLMRLRTIKLPRLTKGRAEAEFFIVFTPGVGVTAVKFLSGSDELRGAGGALASAHYDLTSPDNRPLKLVRRGILDCAAVGSSCEFVLLPTESVNSVN